jgi:hypothetical protein
MSHEQSNQPTDHHQLPAGAVASVETSRRRVGPALALAILILPVVFAWLLLRPGYSARSRVVGFAWVGVFLWAVFTNSARTPKPVLAKAGSSFQGKAGKLSPEKQHRIGPRPYAAGDRTASRASFEAAGLRWPLTAPRGWLGCTKLATWVQVGGIRYGINGAAQNPSLRLHSLNEIWSTDVEKTENLKQAGDNTGEIIKVDTSDLNEAAQALCQ